MSRLILVLFLAISAYDPVQSQVTNEWVLHTTGSYSHFSANSPFGVPSGNHDQFSWQAIDFEYIHSWNRSHQNRLSIKSEVVGAFYLPQLLNSQIETDERRWSYSPRSPALYNIISFSYESSLPSGMRDNRLTGLHFYSFGLPHDVYKLGINKFTIGISHEVFKTGKTAIRCVLLRSIVTPTFSVLRRPSPFHFLGGMVKYSLALNKDWALEASILYLQYLQPKSFLRALRPHEHLFQSRVGIAYTL